MSKWPNFFIVGSAKSGTTSMYYYLKDHPDIFFSTPKEPSYFSNKFLNYPYSAEDKRSQFFMSYLINNEKEYLKLFESSNCKKAIGEATPNYLYYNESAIEIKKKVPDAKIIILLRNPVERAFSSYMMNVRDLDETESFEEALRLEEYRIKQNYHYAWFYKKTGLYYKQVKKFLDTFGKDKVKIVLFDDICRDKKGTLKDVCEFLEVDASYYDDYDFKMFNVSGRPKVKFINYLLRQKNPIRSAVQKILPYHFRHKTTFHILKMNCKKEDMNSSTRKELQNHFNKDIRDLSSLIKKDLSHWLS
ncbi:sulfotransferase family protein [Bacillus cereus]|uniref:Sulfotransferase n=1 Tax=Bacillus cereus TaxID=1396 RepID=A0A9X8NTN5_BACCE|nr:sulfotransferase [Bacillus cereus]RWQ71092.1 sulfotransferase [Bacillus cereus]